VIGKYKIQKTKSKEGQIMNLNILVQSDIFEIALTAVLTTSLTYWLTG